MEKLKELLKHLNISAPKVISTNCEKISEILPEGWCHHNVFSAQQKHGGQTVLGFVVVETDCFFWLVPHSIWKASETEHYDVTTKGEKEIVFIPLKIYDSSSTQWILNSEIKIYKKQNFGIDLEIKQLPSKNFKYEEFKNFDLSKLLFFRNYPLSESDSWEDYQDEQAD
jgi:hypothetical protein